MTFPSHAQKKKDLKILADEFGLVVGENFKILQVTELIINSDNYDEMVAKEMLLQWFKFTGDKF